MEKAQEGPLHDVRSINPHHPRSYPAGRRRHPRLAEDAGVGHAQFRHAERRTSRWSEGRIVGFIRIVKAEGDRYVSPIVVDPQARRLGVGRALMQDARRATARCCSSHAARRFRSTRRWDASKGERERISPDLGEDCDTAPISPPAAPSLWIYR